MQPRSIAKNTLDASQSVNALLKTIRIPPRPSMLVEMQQALNQKELNSKELAKIISQDVALSASLLKLTNSPFFGRRYQAQSVDHAVELLGIEQCGLLMTGIIAKQSVAVKGISLHQFWEVSSQRAQALSIMAFDLKLGSPDLAHTFGLFCDIGFPILMERFPDYVQFWNKASQQSEFNITDLEDQKFNTNHASIGALLGRTWGLPEPIVTAILLQHDYKVLEDKSTSELIRNLVALSLVAEQAIEKYKGHEGSWQWPLGGELACQHLGWVDHDVDDWCEQLHDAFNQGQ
jgi:HD-like signal output (HDOD) protein